MTGRGRVAVDLGEAEARPWVELLRSEGYRVSGPEGRAQADLVLETGEGGKQATLLPLRLAILGAKAGLAPAEALERGSLAVLGWDADVRASRAQIRRLVDLAQAIRDQASRIRVGQAEGFPDAGDFDRQMQLEWQRAAREDLPLGVLALRVQAASGVMWQDLLPHLLDGLLRAGDYPALLEEGQAAILMPGADIPGAAGLAVRLVERRATLPGWGGSTLHVGVAAGFAPQLLDPSELLGRAQARTLRAAARGESGWSAGED